MQRRIYPGILFIGSQKVNIFFFSLDLSFIRFMILFIHILFVYNIFPIPSFIYYNRIDNIKLIKQIYKNIFNYIFN